MKGIQSYFMRRLSQLSDWCQNMLTNYSWPSHMINKFNMCTVHCPKTPDSPYENPIMN